MRLAVAASVVLWLVGGTGALAARAVDCRTPADCFERVIRAQREVVSVQAGFKQTKRIALLREPLVSIGRFMFLRPDRVRWEVVSPEPLVVEIAGDRLRVGDGHEMSTIDSGGATSLFRDLAGIFTGANGYSSGRFTIAAGPAGRYSFVLTPRSPDVARVISTLEIDADPKTRLPRRTVIREPDGDVTEVELSDVVINARIDPGLFE